MRVNIFIHGVLVGSVGCASFLAAIDHLPVVAVVYAGVAMAGFIDGARALAKQEQSS